jgi:hypothetical protein
VEVDREDRLLAVPDDLDHLGLHRREVCARDRCSRWLRLNDYQCRMLAKRSLPRAMPG